MVLKRLLLISNCVYKRLPLIYLYIFNLCVITKHYHLSSKRKMSEEQVTDEVVKAVIELRLQGQNEKAYKIIEEVLGDKLNTYYTPEGIKSLTDAPRNLLCLLQELTIVGYYIPGVRSNVAVLLDAMSIIRADITGSINSFNSFCSNRFWYMMKDRESEKPSFKLVVKDKKKIDFELPRLRLCQTAERWRPLNPSIIQKDDIYVCLLRTVNYKKERAGNYESLEPYNSHKPIRTRNWLLELDKDFNITSKHPIKDMTDHDWSTVDVRGFEDMQIFYIRNEGLNFFATVMKREPDGWRRPSIVHGSIRFAEDIPYIHSFDFYKGPEQGRCEKNWLPFMNEDEGKLSCIYLPTCIGSRDISDDDFTFKDICTGDNLFTISHLRGSGGPIDFTFNGVKGHLVCYHDVFLRETNWRNYVHRFVFYDKKWELIALTQSFYFEYNDIEFVRSMCWKLNDETTVLLGVGLLDKEAWIYQVDVNVICSMLSLYMNC